MQIGRKMWRPKPQGWCGWWVTLPSMLGGFRFIVPVHRWTRKQKEVGRNGEKKREVHKFFRLSAPCGGSPTGHTVEITPGSHAHKIRIVVFRGTGTGPPHAHFPKNAVTRQGLDRIKGRFCMMITNNTQLNAALASLCVYSRAQLKNNNNLEKSGTQIL